MYVLPVFLCFFWAMTMVIIKQSGSDTKRFGWILSMKNAGVGFEEVGGPGVGGLLDSEMSSLVSFAAALRRSTGILKALSSRESTSQGPSYGGCSARRVRLHRRKTCGHVFNQGSIYADKLETPGG